MMIMKRTPFVSVGVVSVLAVGVSAQPPAKPDAAKTNPDVAAYVGDQPITLGELDAKVLKTNMKLAQSLYDARRAVLDQFILERVLGPEAGAKGVKVDEFVRQRIAEKVKPLTDADLESYYNANKTRMGGRTLEQVSGQIRNQLTTQRETEAKGAMLDELKQKAGVRIVLSPPRVDVVIAANDPARGPANAKVTIVEYSDFQ